MPTRTVESASAGQHVQASRTTILELPARVHRPYGEHRRVQPRFAAYEEVARSLGFSLESEQLAAGRLAGLSALYGLLSDVVYAVATLGDFDVWALLGGMPDSMKRVVEFDCAPDDRGTTVDFVPAPDDDDGFSW